MATRLALGRDEAGSIGRILPGLSLEDLRLEIARRRGCVFQRLPLYPKQAAVIDDRARFTITEATTKCGKTMSHIEWLLDEAARANEGQWWWVAPVSDQADIGFRRARDRLRGLIDSRGISMRIGDPIDFDANLTRKSVRLGEATIWFKTADAPDSLFGEDVRGAVADEISRWKEDAWFALYSTLSAPQGRAKLRRRGWRIGPAAGVARQDGCQDIHHCRILPSKQPLAESPANALPTS